MLSIWWLAIRPKTLPASVSPIVLGSALAYYDGAFQWPVFVLASLCALFLQIAVNLANDWADATSGVDTKDRQGPTRVMSEGLMSLAQMKTGLALVCLGALLTGLGVVWLSHWSLLQAGLASLIAVFTYSSGPYPLASNGLGEIAVLLFFGCVAVGGVYFAHSLSLTFTAVGYGIAAGLISAAIMLVNNTRDIETDQAANKKTLAVRIGRVKAKALFRYLLAAAAVVHCVVSYPLGLASLLPVIILAPMMRRVIRAMNAAEGTHYNAVLAKTAQLVMLYCVLASALLITTALIRP